MNGKAASINPVSSEPSSVNDIPVNDPRPEINSAAVITAIAPAKYAVPVNTLSPRVDTPDVNPFTFSIKSERF